MKIVLKLCNIPNVNKDSTYFCNHCCLGKSHRLLASSCLTVYDKYFDHVYTDLWGPSHCASPSGFRYYISFVDANTRFTWMYLLKNKFDALELFKLFKTMVSNYCNSSIKAVQSDWGGEFRPFTKFLTDHGIQHRLICLHTHHQNGVVEHKHRHVVELGLTLLSQAKLPLHDWDHAFVSSLYLINRLPSSVIGNEIPYQKLLNKQADYFFLKVFGCSCFPLLRSYNKHKLQFRTQECVFLSYSNSHKGYKCLAADGRLYISKDVTFNERVFPYLITAK